MLKQVIIFVCGIMIIEEEIDQKKFTSPYHKLAVNLIYTSHFLENRYAKDLKLHGLTLQQFNILRILRGRYPEVCSVTLLMDRMIDKMSNASRIVDRLLEKQLLERRTCNKDRRQVDIAITEKGLDLLKKLDSLETEWEKILKGLNKKEADLMNEFLDKIRKNKQ